jgi:hypothetical protein
MNSNLPPMTPAEYREAFIEPADEDELDRLADARREAEDDNDVYRKG